jgi:hypothetical protein
MSDNDDGADLDEEFERLFERSLDEVLRLPWQHKRLFTVAQIVVLLGMQLRRSMDCSYENVVLAHLINMIGATPSLTREQVTAAYEHIRETPAFPHLCSEPELLFPLEDWLYGCPNSVLKKICPEDAAEIDRAVPPECHLELLEEA